MNEITCGACGNGVTPGTYCQHCGSRLDASQTIPPPVPPKAIQPPPIRTTIGFPQDKGPGMDTLINAVLTVIGCMFVFIGTALAVYTIFLDSEPNTWRTFFIPVPVLFVAVVFLSRPAKAGSRIANYLCTFVFYSPALFGLAFSRCSEAKVWSPSVPVNSEEKQILEDVERSLKELRKHRH